MAIFVHVVEVDPPWFVSRESESMPISTHAACKMGSAALDHDVAMNSQLFTSFVDKHSVP